MSRAKAVAVVAALAGTFGIIVATAGVAGADPFPGWGQHAPPLHEVYVQTNDPSGNQVVSYSSDGAGALTLQGRYATGGLGTQIAGSAVDYLASQDSLIFDSALGLLLAVNGGSDTISAFHAFGGYLQLSQVIGSGGTTPVSIAASGDFVYVLNAGGTGEVAGFRADPFGHLVPIAGSNRNLGLDATATPAFLNTPGQIGFTPSGQQLIVTTKDNGSDVDVFAVGRDGEISASPTVNESASPVPFGFSFNSTGDLVLAQAADSVLGTYQLSPSGTITPISSASNGQAALCWLVAGSDGYFYGANAGSATITEYSVTRSGEVSVEGETSTDAGPVDIAVTPDGRYLFADTGGTDTVDAFSIGQNGSLTRTGTASPELPGHSGLEGIVVL
jgi:6-phosphogluconolactonase (cycloisomerase 2 family)